MLQWCKNRVIFYADRETRNILARLFTDLERKEEKGLEQFFPFLKEQENGFRNIRWSREEEVVYYESPQLPNLDELVEIAKFYGCAFECTYKPPLSGHFYRVLYRDGKLTSPSEAEPIQDSTEITVVDIEGNKKVITDLDAAIALTAEFMEYRPIDGKPTAFDQRMRRYWTDLNAKLNAIKNNRNRN